MGGNNILGVFKKNEIMKRTILIILTLITSLHCVKSQTNLVIGFFNPSQDIVLNGVTTSYDTIFIFNSGKLSVINSQIVVNNAIIVTGSGQLRVENSLFTVNGVLIAHGNSEVSLKDTLLLNCSLAAGAEGHLSIDSALIISNISYVGQYSLYGIDSGNISFSNSEFYLLEGKYGGGFHNHSSFTQNNVTYYSPVGLGMTLGIGGSAQFNAHQVVGGMELIVADTVNLYLSESDNILLWFNFKDGDTANIDLPATLPGLPMSNITHYEFSNSLPNVSGVDFLLELDNCNSVYWALLLQSGCDIEMNNDTLIAIGNSYSGVENDTLNGFINNQFYSCFKPTFNGRNLVLNNSLVYAWNFYPTESTSLVIDSCVFGEILSSGTSISKITNSTCDGSGGYLGASQNSAIYVKNSTLMRMGTGIDIILNQENSSVMLQNSEVIGNITLTGNTHLVFNNTIFSDSITLNDASYFLNLSLDSLADTAINSVIDIMGSIYEKKGPFNSDFITGYSISYSQSDSLNFTNITNAGYNPQIIYGTLENFNTTGLSPNEYLLWLTVFENGDSVTTAFRNVVLNDYLHIDDNFISSYVDIYPNPTKGLLHIESNENFEKISVSIFNLFGAKIYEIENTYNLDLNNLSSGTYFLRIDLNGELETHKIIKIE
jgi:hypothetical protein